MDRAIGALFREAGFADLQLPVISRAGADAELFSGRQVGRKARAECHEILRDQIQQLLRGLGG